MTIQVLLVKGNGRILLQYKLFMWGEKGIDLHTSKECCAKDNVIIMSSSLFFSVYL